jgi:hypothetical protein
VFAAGAFACRALAADDARVSPHSKAAPRSNGCQEWLR